MYSIHTRRFSFLLSSASLVALGCGLTARAEEAVPISDEIVVTASRTAVPLRSVGSAIDVLTAEDIANRPRFEVSDLLREVPGVAVNRSGQLGAQTQVRIRGAEGNHTLVLINGIEAGDPFNNSEFDFANLLTEDVERIEVLRGPQSALYGSQAIGGVVNIITTEGNGPLKLKLQGEGGSFGTYQFSTAANGGGEAYHYAASAGYLRTHGISQAIGGAEKDGHRNLTLNAKGSADVSELLEVSGAIRYVHAFGKEDAQDYTPGSPTQGFVVDSDDNHTNDAIYGKGAIKLKLFDGKWDHNVSAAITDVTSKHFSFGAFSFGTYGRKVDLSYQTDATIADPDRNMVHTLTGYVQFKDETFENNSGFPGPQNQRKSTQEMGYVGEYRLAFAEQLYLSGAVRHDDNDLFKNDTTYRASAAWQIPTTGIKLRGSYGSGVAKPNFFELFGYDPTAFVGNPNLKPERSKGWDVGTDIDLLADKAYISFSYFHTNLHNEIFTDFGVFPFTARNQLGKSERKGVEFSARVNPVPALTLAATYAYVSAKDDAGNQEVRRPKNIASFSASYRFLEDKATVGASVDYNGKSKDVVFTPTIPSGVTTLKSFTLVTLSASYAVMPNVEVYGRVENALDERYQEVFSYNTMGAAAYAGVRVRFGG